MKGATVFRKRAQAKPPTTRMASASETEAFLADQEGHEVVSAVTDSDIQAFVAAVEGCGEARSDGSTAINKNCLEGVVGANRFVAHAMVIVSCRGAANEASVLVGAMIVARAYEAVFDDRSPLELVRRTAIELGVWDDLQPLSG